MKYTIGLLAMLLPIHSGAQSPPVKALTIGGTVPDITITNVYNYPTYTIHLSDLKGKLVILDFWATWCGSCIQTFPEMHDLKKEFGDKLQIVMVNSYYPDSISKVKSFINKRKERTGLPFDLTYALQDSVLMKMFPYKQIPHEVWIKNGVVAAITSARELNSSNIALLLKNNHISLPVKNDNLLFNIEKPLLVDENAGDDHNFLYRSIITKYKNNLGAVIGQKKNKNGEISRVFIINYPLRALFQKAYPSIFKIPLNRLIVDAKPDIKRTIEQPDSFKYCYEIITEPSPESEIEKYMQEDLFRAFHLRAKKEIRSIDCYTVKTNNNIKVSLTKGNNTGFDLEQTSVHKYISNEPISHLMNMIEFITNKPVINETDLNSNIDMEIPKDIYSFSIERLTSFLYEKGFELSSARRPMEVAVISEK